MEVCLLSNSFLFLHFLFVKTNRKAIVFSLFAHVGACTMAIASTQMTQTARPNREPANQQRKGTHNDKNK
jgi:hypothetical protein